MNKCWCHHCEGERRQQWMNENNATLFDSMRALPRYMIVCPDCGNKRCPKANYHGHACTNSNEPGQRGSAY